MPNCKYCNKIFRTNKALKMHIFQVHERRGTKTDKVKFEWKKKLFFINIKKDIWKLYLMYRSFFEGKKKVSCFVFIGLIFVLVSGTGQLIYANSWSICPFSGFASNLTCGSASCSFVGAEWGIGELSGVGW